MNILYISNEDQKFSADLVTTKLGSERLLIPERMGRSAIIIPSVNWSSNDFIATKSPY